MKKEDPNLSLIRDTRLKLNEIESSEDSLDSSSVPSNLKPGSDEEKSSAAPARYQLLKLVGEGVTGQVFQAHDSVLNRLVALKLLFPERLSTPHRVLREARAQAQIEHPHVCKVYEVGEMDGKPYIAMQYVDGVTLGTAGVEMNLKEKICVMQKVCDAVHAAHKEGLIHRDIKPANIMVSKTESEWQPYVTDFGLARDLHTPDRTRTGMLLGTPAYMSPEQARGEVDTIGRRSDVYSLGATLYELISGQKLFHSTSSVQALVKTVQEDPRPLRKVVPGLAADLDTIVMKCLEKDPERRYSSARALSEDLTRFLEGDPILARPPTLKYRLLKKAGKHKAIVAIVLVAATGTLLSAAIGLRSWWKAGKQAEAAQHFGEQAAQIESFLSYASTLPLHDIRPEIKIVRSRMENMQKQMEHLGVFARGPGQYSLGRAYHALNQNRLALEHLKQAWELEYRNPDVAYAMGEVMGGLYREELERAQQIHDEEARRARRKELETLYRDPALRYFRTAGATKTESTVYVEAMIAFYENKYDLALVKTSQAFQDAPWLFEASKLKGDILLFRGSEKVSAGKYELAMQDFNLAGGAYHDAMNIARSDARIYQSECERYIRIIDLLFHQSAPGRELVDKALAVCDQALQINPEDAESYNKKSEIYGQWASHLTNRGEDPVPDLRQCVAMCNSAIQKNPQLTEAYYSLGICQRKLGNEAADKGEDPTDWWAKARISFERAIRLRPRFGSAYKGKALIMIQQAFYEAGKGLDPFPSYDRAIQSTGEAAKINPQDSGAWRSLGAMQGSRAHYEFAHGIDPQKSIALAIGNYQKALQINPNLAAVHYNTGLLFLDRAEYEWSSGADPENSFFQQSLSCFHQEAQVNSDSLLAFDGFARAYLTQALLLLESGKDAGESLRNAQTNMEFLQNRKKLDLDNSLLKAKIELASARWAIRRNQFPAGFQRAAEILQKSLNLNEKHSATYQLLAEVYRRKAEWQRGKGQPFMETTLLGLNFAKKALEFNSHNPEACVEQGILYLMKAEGEGREDLLLQAEASLEKALQLNHFLRRKLEAPLEQIRTAHIGIKQ